MTDPQVYEAYGRYSTLFAEIEARLVYLRSAGQVEANICLIRSADPRRTDDPLQREGNTNRTAQTLYELLLANHRNVQPNDEDVVVGGGTLRRGCLTIGRETYRTVVLSQMDSIRASTLALLLRFAQQGGIILVDRAYPQRVDGMANPQAVSALTEVAPLMADDDAWKQALTTDVPPLFMLDGKNTETITAHLRSVEGGHTLWLSSGPVPAPNIIALHLADYSVRTALLDPVSGRTFVLRQEEDGSYRLAFTHAQMWVVCFGEFTRNFVFDGIYAVPYPRQAIAALEGAWSGKRLDPNALTLDCARCSQDDGITWSAPESVRDIFKQFSSPSHANRMVRLRYAAQVTDIPVVCRLAVHETQRYASITMNGQPVTFSTNDCFMCETLHTGDVAAFLKPGENEIELVLDGETATRAGHIQNIYLTGDFAVTTDPPPPSAPSPLPYPFARASIVKERTPSLGDLVPQGYPFYAGTFVLEATVDLPHIVRGMRYLLTFPSFQAAVLQVTVNGGTFFPLLSHPWETDISTALRSGRNTVRIELANTRYNQTNPHILNDSSYSVVPFGLFTPPVIVEVTDR
ncbi:MAG: hypothetical protein FWH21_00030 [Kiritimatiellaeota bacterium]|nr:hypothetical protein [Kiritimatiellota bacterium]